MSDARWRAKIGTEVRRYRIDALIGVGGMGAVFAATHQNRRRFALKFLAPEIARRGDLRARFVREGLVANTIGHPGVVAITDDEVTDEGQPFLVMELLDGATIDVLRARGDNLTARDAVEIAIQVLDVLVAAHAKGIVHRDIKPQNLFLTRKGKIKVLDFGIARLHDAESTTMTRMGESFGTPGFKPREQELGLVDEIDGRTDLWALGATIFHLVTGEHVHLAETPEERSIYASTRPARSLHEVAPGAPDGLVAIVDRALAFQREDRWPSASAMRDALVVLAKSGALGGAPDLAALAARSPVAAWVDPAFLPTEAAPVRAESALEQKLLDEGEGAKRRNQLHTRAIPLLVGGGVLVVALLVGVPLWQAHARDAARARAWSRTTKCLVGAAHGSPAEAIELELASDAAVGTDYPKRCAAYLAELENVLDKEPDLATALHETKSALEEPADTPPFSSLPTRVESLFREAERAGLVATDVVGVTPPPAPLASRGLDELAATKGSPSSWRAIAGPGTWLTDGSSVCRLDGAKLRCRAVDLPVTERGRLEVRRDGTVNALTGAYEEYRFSTWTPTSADPKDVTVATPGFAANEAVVASGWLLWVTPEGALRAIDGAALATKPVELVAPAERVRYLDVESCGDRVSVVACGEGNCLGTAAVRRLERVEGAWKVTEPCPKALSVAYDEAYGFWRLRVARADGTHPTALIGPAGTVYSLEEVAARRELVIVQISIRSSFHLFSLSPNAELTPIDVVRE